MSEIAKALQLLSSRRALRGGVASSVIGIGAVLALLNFGAAATADSLKIRDLPLAGDYGGRDGHTITIDGKICRLRNSEGIDASQGCNYEVSVGTNGDAKLHSRTLNNGCSVDCELVPRGRALAPPRRRPPVYGGPLPPRPPCPRGYHRDPWPGGADLCHPDP